MAPYDVPESCQGHISAFFGQERHARAGRSPNLAPRDQELERRDGGFLVVTEFDRVADSDTGCSHEVRYSG
jgi:hypothetical protein